MSTMRPSDAFPADIYTEPSGVDLDTLRNLGPLGPLAGVWSGDAGVDRKPKADGPREQTYVERMALQPVDPVTNGPQLLYGLRYEIHITKPQQRKTYHEQVGYFLWEPSTGTVVHTLTIPRGQVVLSLGQAASDARSFEVRAHRDDPRTSIGSVPFLEDAFRTIEFRMKVTIESDDAWSYEEDTVLQIRGNPEPFHHTDHNRLVRIGAPTPNPLARPE